MATSAQDAYLNESYPGATPIMSGWQAMSNWFTGSWDREIENWQADKREWSNNRSLQKAQWEREDSYYQRIVDDMKKAGLNPYYALNNNLVSSSTNSAESLQKTRRNKEKEKDSPDFNLKGLIVTALLLMKLLA